METETIYQQLSKDELMSTFSMLLEKPKNLEAIAPLNRETLAKRVRRVLSAELLGTLLDGLTPEEVEMFIDVIFVIGSLLDGEKTENSPVPKIAEKPPSPSPTPIATITPTPEPIPKPSPIPQPPPPQLVTQPNALPVEVVSEKESNDSWTDAQEIPPIGATPNALTAIPFRH